MKKFIVVMAVILLAAINLYAAPGDVNVEGNLDVGKTISGFGVVPIGSIVAWHKSITSPAPLTLPDGWVECNGQTLNDQDSPLNGLMIPNLNLTSNGDYLDGYASGAFLRGSDISGITQQATANPNVFGHQNGGYFYMSRAHSGETGPNDMDKRLSSGWLDGMAGSTPWGAGNGTLTYAGRPVNMSVVWIMRVK